MDDSGTAGGRFDGSFRVETPADTTLDRRIVVSLTLTKKLGDVSIELQCPYASVVLTALDRGASLANTKSALISAIARNSNTGYAYFTVDGKTLDNGKEPIVLEPVKAVVSMAARPIDAVNVLDHSGRRTGKQIAVTGSHFTLDGARDRAMYYEIVFR